MGMVCLHMVGSTLYKSFSNHEKIFLYYLRVLSRNSSSLGSKSFAICTCFDSSPNFAKSIFFDAPRLSSDDLVLGSFLVSFFKKKSYPSLSSSPSHLSWAPSTQGHGMEREKVRGISFFLLFIPLSSFPSPFLGCLAP